MAALTQHALRKWRERGYHVENGETITRLGGNRMLRHDTFGFADKLCVKGGTVGWVSPLDVAEPGELVLLQVTSWGNVSARCNKISRDCKEIAEALLSVPGVRIVVEGWKKMDTPGEDGRWWQSREVEITFEEIARRQV